MNKKFFKKFLSIFICISIFLSFSSSAFKTVFASTLNFILDINYVYDSIYKIEKDYVIYERNNKKGIAFNTGKVVDAKYDFLGDFNEGMFIVMIGDKFGFIDKTGKEIVPIKLKYNDVGGFNEGMAKVRLGDKWGYIDKTGKEIIAVKLKYDEVHDFSDGMAKVRLGDKWGYIDKTGKEIVPVKYDEAYDFSEGIAKVRLGNWETGKWGYIDKTGKEIIPIKYDEVSDFVEGIAKVRLGDKWGCIDRTGKEIVPIKYDYIVPMENNTYFISLKNKFGIAKFNTSVTGVALKETNKTVKIGESFNLIAIVSPINATNKNVTWSSSNPKVATVDKNGKVTAVGVGTAIITVKTVDGGKTATCKVEVNPIKVTGIKLNKTVLSLKKGSKFKLIATVSPINATNKKVIWSSSNTNLVEVDANGNITTLRKGTAIITVKTVDGGYKATCKIIVK